MQQQTSTCKSLPPDLPKYTLDNGALSSGERSLVVGLSRPRRREAPPSTPRENTATSLRTLNEALGQTHKIL